LAYPLFHPRCRRQAPLTLSRDAFAREFPAEDAFVEFKTGVGTGQIQSSAVAFSNADGGVVLVGVGDDGTVVGRMLNPGTADAIHTAMSDGHDLGRYEVSALDVDGTAITVISIARREEGFAQTSNGRVLVRRGTLDMPIFGADLQRLINERSAVRFEATLTGVPVEAADGAAFERLRKACGWPSVGPVEGLLADAGLVHGQRLSVAGALILLADPGVELGKAYVEILRYSDDTTHDYDRREEIRGPLDHQVRAATTAIMDHLGTDLVVLGVRRFDLPRLPEVVVREALANAVAHRSYEAKGTPVRVELRPGAVTITSPGSLPEPVTVSNMRETSAARNLSVMRILRRFELAEDAGRGVDVMQDTMRSEMLEQPEFRDTGHSVVVTLPLRATVAPVERAWIRELESRGHLEVIDRPVLVHAARGELLTNAAVRRIVGADSRQAGSILARLRDQGLLRQHGQRGGATYTLADSLRPPAGLRLGADDLAAMVERLADGGPISNADVRRATGVDRTESLSLLERLVREGRLIRTGERRGTRYHRPEA